MNNFRITLCILIFIFMNENANIGDSWDTGVEWGTEVWY